jgi:hypothetical protein
MNGATPCVYSREVSHQFMCHFFLLLGTDTILQEENSFKDSSLEDLQCMSATEITSKYLKISIQGTEDNCLLKPELDIKRNKVFNVMMSNFQSRPTIIVL